MRALLLCFSMLGVVSPAQALTLTPESVPQIAPTVTLGLAMSLPDIVGAYLSVWPLAHLSIDGRITLGSAEGGLSAHVPLGVSTHHQLRHDLVVTALGGYTHGVVHQDVLPYHGGRVVGLAGYGLVATGWEMRMQAGVLTHQIAPQIWARALAAQLLLGKVF